MGRNVKQQHRICGPHISNKFVVLTRKDNYIRQLIIFTGVGFTA